MMEVGVCVMCEGSITSPLESTKELFRPTLTLERTLGMLSSGSSVSSFDTKTLFNVLTSEEGSSVCLKCSSILHTGLEVTSQILVLEGRLRNLGARVRTTVITESCKNNRLVRKSPRNKPAPGFSKLFPASTSSVFSSDDTKAEGPNNKTKEAMKREYDVATSSKECQEIQTERISSRYPRRTRKNVTTPSSAPSHSHQTLSPSKSAKSAPPIRKTRTVKPVHGVQRCPSCDFSVDVRSPAEANSSSPLPRSLCESLRKRSKQQLITHFRDSHMDPRGKDNFKRISDGIKVFCCPQPDCSYTHFQYRDIASHFMSNHLTVRVRTSSAEPSTYSCPEKNCSFLVEVKETPQGIKIRNAVRHAKDTLAAHVFSAHDIPSYPSLKNLKRNEERSLFIEDSIGDEARKVYRCVRCDYEDVLPKEPQRTQYMVARNNFLRHFYDEHLT